MIEQSQDAEFVESSSTSLAVRTESAPIQQSTFFSAMRPAEKVAFATEVADALKPILTSKKLTHKLNSRNSDDEFVELEGWQTCANLCGLAPKIEWTRAFPDGSGYEARAVVVRVDTGIEVGSGESMCSRSESKWKTRDDFALRSMAQTRAQSRALRGLLAWILVLAGYKPTPAEEMPPLEPVTAQFRPAPQSQAKSVAEVAKAAFEIAKALKVVPDDKIAFRDYVKAKFPAMGWNAVLAALENMRDAAAFDDGLEQMHAEVDAELAAANTTPKDSKDHSEPFPSGAEDAEADRDRMRKRVFALCRELKLEDDERHELLRLRYSQSSLNDITTVQLSDFIAYLEEGKSS